MCARVHSVNKYHADKSTSTVIDLINRVHPFTMQNKCAKFEKHL